MPFLDSLSQKSASACNMSSFSFVILSYLNQISMRESEYAQRNPHARLIRLGIGDTTEPIPEIITSAMAEVIATLKS